MLSDLDFHGAAIRYLLLNLIIIFRYFTIGYWNETQSVEVDLVKGSNTLVFTRYSTTQTTFKAFKLYVAIVTVPLAMPLSYHAP